MLKIINRILRSVKYKIYYIFNKQTDICFIYGKSSNKFNNLDAIKCILNGKYNLSIIEYGERSSIALKKIAKAKIIIIDQASFYLYDIHLGKNSSCIQVWHAGGAFKKVAFDATIKDRSQRKEEKRISRIHNNISFFVCSSSHVAKIYSKAFRIPESRMLVFGLPRIDAYFADKNIVKSKNKNIYILYAPTFRKDSSGVRVMPELPDAVYISNYLCKHGIKNTYFAYRSHPSVESSGDIDGWLDWSPLDQKEALSKSSILITDYSSIFFDYLIFRRKIIFYHPDRNEYLNNQRELYFDPNDYKCFDVCKSVDDLCKSIELSFSQNVDYDEFWNLEMGACDGKSSERLCNFISEKMN
ncbi:MAG: CDP-glycerol glycerophosphotransferase family protein [Desulfovibrio sp.]|nr:CDP-glycerol glycerophosphotransferase family protein [Desulfovibrio sp.]